MVIEIEVYTIGFMAEAIERTDFDFPGQVGPVYRGKVGDVYTIDHPTGELLVVVRTDRISAFDVVLPATIPYKGQVLNQLSGEFLEASSDVAPNWLVDTPDPNVSVGLRAEPFQVEMIMRGFLLGSSWAAYDTDGVRNISGNRLRDGMAEFQAFKSPLLTPTTKAHVGHDENITPKEIVSEGLATKKEFDEMARLAIALFAAGQSLAREKGLVLADTKYEFGKLATGQIIVIDEVHTPDSSRYFHAEEFDRYLNGETKDRPEQISKEFVREWLKEQGFSGKEGQVPPPMGSDIVNKISARYIDLYERMSGYKFRKPESANNPIQRILDNVLQSLWEIGR